MPTIDIQTVLEHRAQVEAFQRKHRIGLLTLLFTDIVGSTRIKQNLGDAEGFDRIQVHHAAVRETLKRFPEGEEISTAGDSFFIVFAKPSEAVKFALMLQSRLRELAQKGAQAVFDRIGIHIGEVIIEESGGATKKDLYGMQVDICGRVMSSGDGDQILMTRSTFDNARQVIKGKELEGLRSLVWLNHGAYVMQGVEEPLEICEVGEEGLARLRPPVDSEKVRRFVSATSVSPDTFEKARLSSGGSRSNPWRWIATAVVLLGIVVAAVVMLRREKPSSGANSTGSGATESVLERIGFEVAEGYAADKPLIGQLGWTRGGWPGQLDSGGQGVSTGLIPGSSQQAFLGGVAGATAPGMHASLNRKLFYAPAQGRGSAKITWKQLIKPSSDQVGNLFEWLWYDRTGKLLCGIVFDNSTHKILRRFPDNTLGPTALSFNAGEVMEVTLTIDFQRNQWSAVIGGDTLPPRPLGQDNRELSLGSMAVTWRSVAGNARVTGGPVAGDNLLAFDDLVVTALRE